MAGLIKGATLYQTNKNESDYRYDTLGKNSEVFAVGDPIVIASGVVKVVAAATDVPVGVIGKAQTMTSTNQTVAKVYPSYIPLDADTVFLMGCNAALTDNATDGGTFYKLTFGTGAVQIDVASGAQVTTARQVVIIKVDPNNVGGTEGPQQALVKFFRTEALNI